MKPAQTRPALRGPAEKMEVMNMENAVTGKTLIGEIVNQHPEAIEILLSIGMHCLGCPASRGETVEEACMVHGLTGEQMDKLLDIVNEEANRDFDDEQAAE